MKPYYHSLMNEMKVRVREMRQGHFRTGIIPLLLLLVLIPLSCTTSKQETQRESMKAAAIEEVKDTVVLDVDGGTYIPDLTHHYELNWESGMRVSDVLKASGVIKLSEDQKSIASVSDASLDPNMAWGVTLNDKELLIPQQLNKQVYAKDRLVVYVKKLEVKTSSAAASDITITLQEAQNHAKVHTSTFVIPWETSSKLTDILNQFGPVELSPDHTAIQSIEDDPITEASDVRVSLNGERVDVSKLDAIRIEPASHLTIEWNSK